MRMTFSALSYKIRNASYLFFVILIILMSCTYDPGNEITFKQIDPVSVTGTFSLDDIPEGDTIVLYQTLDLKFTIGVDKGEIKGVRAYANTKQLEAYVNNGKGTLKLYVGYGGLGTGTYALTLEIISSAATNSIADNLGLETRTIKKSWLVKVDIDPPPIPNLKFSQAGGFLKVSWDPYLKKNFTSYDITYGVEDQKMRFVQIKDPLKSFWIDSSYVTGFQVNFQVQTNTILGFSRTDGFYVDSPQLKTQYTEADCTITLQWTRARFEQAIKSYVISENGVVIKEFQNVGDTTYKFKLDAVCGVPVNVDVSYQPMYSRYRTWKLFGGVSQPLALQTLNIINNEFIIWKYNTTLGKLIGFNYNTSEWNMYDRNFISDPVLKISTLGVYPAIPVQGNYGYFMSGSSVVRFDLSTGEQTSHQELGTLTGASIASASGTGIVSMIGNIQWPNGPRNEFSQIKQFSADEYIYFSTDSYNYHPTYAMLSGDGKYAYFPRTGKLYLVGTSSLTLIGDLPGAVIDFRPDDNEELITFRPLEDVKIYRTADLSLKRTIPCPKAGYTYQFYDPVTNTVMFTNPSFDYLKYIVHIETGEITEVKCAEVKNYINGSLFFTETLYRKIL
jgi:hypothetical protein